MEASRSTRLASLRTLGVVALTLPLLLSACSSEPGATSASPSSDGADPGVETPTSTEPEVTEPAAGATAAATVTIGADTFEFSPTTCLVGLEDIVVQGPGSNTQTGELAFLDIDFVSYEGEVMGGVDVELGTDQPFTSPDDYFRLDTYSDSRGFTLAVTGESFTAEGQFRANPEGSSSAGTIAVRCDAP